MSTFFRLLALALVLHTIACRPLEDDTPDVPETPTAPPLTDQEQALVTALDLHLRPFAGTEPSATTAEFDAVFAPLGDARIVGMGEATHGTREFFSMKHRLFRYLVETHGFRFLGFEFDVAQGLILNAMLQSGEGDVDAYVRNNESMQYWPWSTEEVRDLFVWMQDYNRGKPEAEKVHVVGVDCQFFTFYPQAIRNLLLPYDAAVADSVYRLLIPYQEFTYHDKDPSQIQNIRATLLQTLRTAEKTVMDREQDIRAAEGQVQWTVLRHLLDILFQIELVEYTSVLNWSNSILVRDDFMAKNTSWIMTRFGNDAKIALWAHNAHVGNDDTMVDYGPGSQGYHLKSAYGNAYQSVGFTMGAGKFNAIASGTFSFEEFSVGTPLRTSVNFLMHRASSDIFAVRMADLLSEPVWQTWTSEPKRILSIGAGYNPSWATDATYPMERLDRKFDWIIHLETTTPTRLWFE